MCQVMWAKHNLLHAWTEFSKESVARSTHAAFLPLEKFSHVINAVHAFDYRCYSVENC